MRSRVRLRIRVVSGLVCLGALGAWWALLREGFSPATIASSNCAELRRGVSKKNRRQQDPTSTPHSRPTWWSGIGVFATRRFYHSELKVLHDCADALAAESPNNTQCPLAVALSERRVVARDEARSRSNIFARRLSHFLDCGLRGWIADCTHKPSDFYFVYYYNKTFKAECDATNDAPSTCEPLCRHLLLTSARSRRWVDEALSERHEKLCKLLIALAALCGFLGAAFPERLARSFWRGGAPASSSHEA